MENIIIPIVNENMIEYANRVLNENKYRVLIGVVECLASKIYDKIDKRNEVIVFKDGTRMEEIVNAFANQLDEGKVLISRKELTDKEISKFFTSSSDITICSEKRNTLKNYFFKIWQYIIKFLFGFELFDGDISAVCFGERLFPVISNIKNLSYSSRVNKWKYVSISKVDTEKEPIVKDYNKKRSFLTVICWSLLFVATIISTIVFYQFYDVKFLSLILLISAILFAFIGFAVSCAILYLKQKIGDRSLEKGKKIK